MIGDIFVFDNVIHVYDLSEENLRTDQDDAEYSRSHFLSLGAATRWSGYNAPLLPGSPAAQQSNKLGLDEYAETVEFGKRWTHEEIYKMVFVDAPTDLAMAQVVPIFDWFEGFFAPVMAQYEMAKTYPDKVLFCGGVDPNFKGMGYALEQIKYQAEELGACSMKFYNGHVKGSWRCDDKELAYPLYERCREFGINVLQFHKGVPFGMQNLEDVSPLDLQAPARDFPDMTFIIHHLAVPYFEEVVSIGARFENVYLALSGNICFYLVAPRLVQEQLGRLLRDVGPEKLLWGSEAALSGGPAPYLKAFMELEIPEDLRSGYGYPQITHEDKRKILGENFARLMHIDLN